MLWNILNFIIFGETLILFTNALTVMQKRQTNKDKNPQPCPENPIIFNAKSTPQYIYSPYDSNGLYPENCDCHFVILTSTPNHRVQITIISSEMEEPLFTECNDYCIIYDGESNEAPELVKWCGSSGPKSITSSNNSLYLHFHSDSIIQKRGFNLSFIEYNLSNCPPGYLIGRNNKYCYKLFSFINNEITWMNAQRKCNYDQANLLTFENLNEFEFVKETFVASHTFPWIGYHDINAEGKYEGINPNENVWPENFPHFGEHIQRDCIYLDFQKKDNFSIDDCRNRHTFICKKLRNGLTVPIFLFDKFAAYGIQNRTNWTKIIFIFILIIFLAIILFLIGWKLKQKRASNQIHNIDNNQKLVANINDVEAKPTTSNVKNVNEKNFSKKIIMSTQQTSDSTNSLRQNSQNKIDAENEGISNENKFLPNSNEKHFNQTNLNNINDYQTITEDEIDDDIIYSPRISITPNQPLSNYCETNDSNENLINNEFNNQQQISIENNCSEEISINEMFKNQLESSTTNRSQKMDSENNEQNFISNEREDTTIRTTTVITSKQNGTRALLKHKSFNRPRVGVLDSVSAISMDEFWQKNSF